MAAGESKAKARTSSDIIPCVAAGKSMPIPNPTTWMLKPSWKSLQYRSDRGGPSNEGQEETRSVGEMKAQIEKKAGNGRLAMQCRALFWLVMQMNLGLTLLHWSSIEGAGNLGADLEYSSGEWGLGFDHC